MDKIKKAGAAGAVAIAFAAGMFIGAGGESLPVEVGGHAIEITQVQWDGMAAEAVRLGIYPHDAGTLTYLRLSDGDKGAYHGLLLDVDPAAMPADAKGVPASYVKALREAAAAQ